MSGMHRRLVVVTAAIALTGCLAALPLGANNGKGHGHNPHATTTTRATTTTVKPTTTTGSASSTSTSSTTTIPPTTTTQSTSTTTSTATSTSTTSTTVPSTAWQLQTSSGHPNLFATLTSADGNAYTAQTNEWGVTGSCSPWPTLTIGGTGVEMGVLGSLINQGQSGCSVCQFCPGAYPSIFRTTKAYNETVTALQVPATVTTSVGTDTSKVAAGDGWDDAYDIWFSSSSTGSCPSGCMELMIWLDRHNEFPAGSFRQMITLDGIAWDEYYNGTKTVSFVAHTPRGSVTGLDLGPFANESVNLGAMADTWVLNNVSMGFELWTGGANLAMTSPFQVCVQGHGC